MKFQKLIDKESIILDGKRLADFNRGDSLSEKIDDIKYEFINNNDLTKEWGVMTLICKFAQEIKDKL